MWFCCLCCFFFSFGSIQSDGCCLCCWVDELCWVTAIAIHYFSARFVRCFVDYCIRWSSCSSDRPVAMIALPSIYLHGYPVICARTLYPPKNVGWSQLRFISITWICSFIYFPKYIQTFEHNSSECASAMCQCFSTLVCFNFSPKFPICDRPSNWSRAI